MKLKGEKLAVDRLERAKRLVQLSFESGNLLPDSIENFSLGSTKALAGVILILHCVIQEQHKRLKIREEKDLWQQRLA